MKHLYNLPLLTYGMKKFINQNKTIFGLIAILALSLSLFGQQNKVFGLMEDQLEVCNFEQVCQTINIDDYMTRAKADKIQNNFNNELNTYDRELINSTQNKLDFHEDILEQLDTECRDTYHKWCFGPQWAELSEVLTH